MYNSTNQSCLQLEENANHIKQSQYCNKKMFVEMFVRSVALNESETWTVGKRLELSIPVSHLEALILEAFEIW